MTINIFKGDCKITLEEDEEKGGKGKGSLAAVGNIHYLFFLIEIVVGIKYYLRFL